jgi:hypothetical protein
MARCGLQFLRHSLILSYFVLSGTLGKHGLHALKSGASFDSSTVNSRPPIALEKRQANNTETSNNTVEMRF